MIRHIKRVLLFFLLATPLFAQFGTVGNMPLVGRCPGGNQLGFDQLNNVVYSCDAANPWKQVTGIVPVYPVTSVFGRTGAVVAVANDYNFNQIAGNIVVTQMNSGTGASASTFWRGDGTWSLPPVTSVFGRTGAVVAATNDYNFSQLAGNIAIAQIAGGVGASSSTFLRGDNTWAAPAASAVTSVFGRTGAVVAATNDYNFNQLAGNISVTQMNSGVNASASTVWYGNGTWFTVVGSFNGRTGAVAPTSGDYAFSQIGGNISVGQMNAGTGASAATYWRGDGTWDAPVTAFNGRTGAVSPTSGDYSFSQISGNISTSQMNSGSGAGVTTFWRGDGVWAAVSASTLLNVSTSGTGKVAFFSSGTTCATNNNDSNTCSGSFTITGSPFTSTPFASCTAGFIAQGFPHLIASGATAANTISYTVGNGTTAGAVVSQYANIDCVAFGN